MATAPQQGIMALPENDQVKAPPQLGLDDSYDAAKSGAMEANPELTSQLEAQMAEAMPELEQMSEEQLNALLQLFQYMHDHPEEYKKIVQMLVEQGKFSEGDLPPEYDDQFIATMTMILLEARRQRGSAEITPAASQQAAQPMQPPAQFARGGIADAARAVAAKGRSGDTMLAHITPKEAKMLRKKGGVGTINPATGLPEYGLLGDIVGAVTAPVRTVANIAKKVLASPVGKIAATIAIASFIGPYAASLGLGTAGTAALTMAGASAGITALSGGNLKDIIKSGTMGAVLGYGGAVLGPAIAPAGWGAGATAAVGAGAAGAGLGLVQGKSINDAVQQGISAAALAGLTTYVQTGMYSQPTVDPTTGQITSKGLADTGPSTGSGTGVNPDGSVTDQSVLAPSEGQWRGASDWASSNPNPNTSVAPPVDTTSTIPTQRWDGANAWAANSNNMSVPQNGVDPNMSVPTEGSNLSNTGNTNNTNVGGQNTGAEKGYWDQTKQFYNENISPSGRAQAGMQDAQAAADKAYNDAIASGKSEAIALRQYDAALKANTPGVISNYGPAVAGGLLAVNAMGGFKPKQPQPEPGSVAEKMKGTPGEDIVRANPKAYIAQNLPGVTYDSAGNVVSTSTWTPSGTMADVRAGNTGYVPYTAPERLPVYQPQPQANTYGQPQYNFRPQYAAQGGIMEKMPQHYAAGGFTQTPLSADPGPVMAMGAQNVSMNTPGVPMNLPMHFASGGSASSKIAEAISSGNVGGAFSALMPTMNAMIGQASGLFGGPSPAMMAAFGGQQAAAPAPMATAPASSAMGPVNYAPTPARVSSYAANPQASAIAAKMVAAAKDAVASQPQGVNLNNMTARVPAAKAMGGIASLATGGYPRRNGQISGPGTETSDSIPAMLSDGEFVMTAKAVRGAGKGDRRAGAKKMYALMHQLEKNAARG